MYAEQIAHRHEGLSLIADQTTPGKKIMVVDDDPLLLEIFAEYLTCQGYAVTPICESRLIAETIQQQKFDYIICDYNMPDFDFEKDLLTLWTSEFFPEVIMVTGDPRLAEDEKFSFPVLIKPFDFKQLKAVLSRPARKSAPDKYYDTIYQ